MGQKRILEEFTSTAARLAATWKQTEVGERVRDLEDGNLYIIQAATTGTAAYGLDIGAEPADPATTGALLPLWRNDVPGDPFLDGDTVAAPGPLTSATTLFGRRIMVLSASGETVTVTMPAIAADNAGQVVAVYDQAVVKDYGTINLDPATGDSIAGGPANTTRSPTLGEMAPWLEMSSDGNDDWLCTVGMQTVGPAAAFSP